MFGIWTYPLQWLRSVSYIHRRNNIRIYGFNKLQNHRIWVDEYQFPHTALIRILMVNQKPYSVFPTRAVIRTRYIPHTSGATRKIFSCSIYIQAEIQIAPRLVIRQSESI